MKRVSLTLAALLVALSAFGMSTHVEAQPVVTDESSSVANVIFTHLLTIEEVVKLTSEADVTIVMLESEFSIGFRSFYDFYLMPEAQETPIDVEKAYQAERMAFVADTLALLDTRQGEQEIASAFDTQAMKLALSNSFPSPIAVQSATILGTAEAISNLADKYTDDVASIEFADVNRMSVEGGNEATSESPSELVMDESAALATTVSDTVTVDLAQVPSAAQTWYPNKGEAFVQPSVYPDQRYTGQFMWWNRNTFSSKQTYEHDFFLDNSDNATYLNPTSTSFPGCFPVVKYASTTWPAESRPYLDTRFDKTKCERSELAYTIGAAKAEKIPAGQWQYNYIRTSNGNSSSDKFKVSAQLGERRPSTCYTTWCSFDIITYRPIPAWLNQVPGYSQWDFYQVTARHSNKCLDVTGGSLSNGGNVQQWACHGGANQVWSLVRRQNGYYQISAVHSGKCLDVTDWATRDGANIQQWGCHGGNNQLWTLVRSSNDFYKVISRHSGKCVDVTAWSTGNGANVQQWTCHGGANQLWKFAR